jgi:hypothetical protein
VQVLSGQVYIAGEVIDWHNTESRNRNVKLQLLDAAQHYRLPDVDFLLLTGDWPPEDRSGQSTGCPLQGPVFMQVTFQSAFWFGNWSFIWTSASATSFCKATWYADAKWHPVACFKLHELDNLQASASPAV